MNVLLLGPQGSGKGTQGKRIAAEYGLAHIATGDMLRSAIAADGAIGRQVKPILASGELVPDELMIALIHDRLHEPDAASGFILDGFPRTMPQAEALDGMLTEIGRTLTLVFELQVAEDICIERLRRRALEEGRPDDTPEVIKTRLDRYHQATEPLIEYYRTRGNLVGIHADLPIDAVFAEIQQAIEQVEERPSSEAPVA